jgi:hypothetical protein
MPPLTIITQVVSKTKNDGSTIMADSFFTNCTKDILQVLMMILWEGRGAETA